MYNTDLGSGNYGVPHATYVNEFGDLEFHYTWFTTMDDALEYAYQLNDTPLELNPPKWCAVENIITLGV